MLRLQQYNTPHHFDSLFKIFSSARFLNKEGLGGELPFFIHSFPIIKQAEVDSHVSSLIKRLKTQGIDIYEVNLYHLCLDILKRENQLDAIIARDKSLPKIRLQRILNSILNIETVVIPEIHRRLAEVSAKIVFLTGVGAVFPIIRSHTILNNLQTLVGDLPLVMFFPGTYNNHSLTLFDRLKDDNYYRAHNLNEYTI